jgi:hypothetical protein
MKKNIFFRFIINRLNTDLFFYNPRKEEISVRSDRTNVSKDDSYTGLNTVLN